MLGTDSVAARAYLRRVQHLAGPVPFDVIAEAMRRVPGFEVDRVAALVTADHSGTAATDADQAVEDDDGARTADADRADG
jgi:hypothetical protein